MSADVTTTALDARHKDLVQKTYFDAKLKKVDDKVGKISSDILLYESRVKQKEDTLHDLERYKSHLTGTNYFDDSDGTQNYLVFQGVYKYFEDVDVSKTLIEFLANSWISKGISNEKISSVTGFERPFLEYTNARIKLKFNESILRKKFSWINSKLLYSL